MRIGIVYVITGDKDLNHLKRSVRAVKNFKPDIPIIVWSDIDLSINRVEIRKYDRIPFKKNEGYRNSSLFRLEALIQAPWDIVCYLDNDLYVVHKGFFEGFKIAEKMGIAMPINPRSFLFTYEKDMGDMEIGRDVQEYDIQVCKGMPRYMTAINATVIFLNKKNKEAMQFITMMLSEQKNYPSRGQAILCRTIHKLNMSPYVLSQQWCTSRKKIERPLALHVGGKKKRKIYRWWKRKFQKITLCKNDMEFYHNI